MSRLHKKKTEITIEESHKFFVELETRYASINNMTDNDLVKENDELTKKEQELLNKFKELEKKESKSREEILKEYNERKARLATNIKEEKESLEKEDKLLKDEQNDINMRIDQLEAVDDTFKKLLNNNKANHLLWFKQLKDDNLDPYDELNKCNSIDDFDKFFKHFKDKKGRNISVKARKHLTVSSVLEKSINDENDYEDKDKKELDYDGDDYVENDSDDNDDNYSDESDVKMMSSSINLKDPPAAPTSKQLNELPKQKLIKVRDNLQMLWNMHKPKERVQNGLVVYELQQDQLEDIAFSLQEYIDNSDGYIEAIYMNMLYKVNMQLKKYSS